VAAISPPTQPVRLKAPPCKEPLYTQKPRKICPRKPVRARVGDVLTHELCHAAVGLEAGHGPLFRRCALAVGLSGQMRATVASPALIELLTGFLQVTGPYPHAQLTAADRPTKKDGTRLLKVVCPECGYTERVTRKWLDVGLPVCPCDEEMAEGV